MGRGPLGGPKAGSGRGPQMGHMSSFLEPNKNCEGIKSNGTSNKCQSKCKLPAVKFTAMVNYYGGDETCIGSGVGGLVCTIRSIGQY